LPSAEKRISLRSGISEVSRFEGIALFLGLLRTKKERRLEGGATGTTSLF
jgi:hypothetical protein